jgi:hypothetical protein
MDTFVPLENLFKTFFHVLPEFGMVLIEIQIQTVSFFSLTELPTSIGVLTFVGTSEVEITLDIQHRSCDLRPLSELLI